MLKRNYFLPGDRSLIAIGYKYNILQKVIIYHISSSYLISFSVLENKFSSFLIFFLVQAQYSLYFLMGF